VPGWAVWNRAILGCPIISAPTFRVDGNDLRNKCGGAGYWQQNGWPAAAAVLVAGAVCWFLGRRLNKPASKDAGEHRRTWTHDLLFVRMEWWAFPLAAVAAAIFLTGWKPGELPHQLKAASQETQKLTSSK